MGTLGTLEYREIFLIYRKIFEKSYFKKILVVNPKSQIHEPVEVKSVHFPSKWQREWSFLLKMSIVRSFVVVKSFPRWKKHPIEEAFHFPTIGKLPCEKGSSPWDGSFRWEGRFPARRELSSHQEVCQWEGSFPVSRNLPSDYWVGSFPSRMQLPNEKEASQWEESFSMRGKLPSEKEASRWEGSFPVRRNLTSEKEAYHLVGIFIV